MKDGWYLVSSLAGVTGGELVQRYSRRFTIEELPGDNYGSPVATITLPHPE
jgi:hypothetical protein